MSVAVQASLALTASTAVHPEQARDIVKLAAREIKSFGARVSVEDETAECLTFYITGARSPARVCTFPARIAESGERTNVSIGGLDWYRTFQAKMLGFIPIGCRSVLGIVPYRKFLDSVATSLRSTDGSAHIHISTRSE